MTLDWVKLSIWSNEESLELISELFVQVGASGTAIYRPHNADVQICGFLPSDDGVLPKIEWLYERLFIGFDEGILQQTPQIETNLCSESKWMDQWKKSIKPISIGKMFLVKPTWLELTNLSNRHLLKIDGSGGFGTGHHPTTRICLELMEGLPFNGKSVLDLGCGSGILSIGSKKLGAKTVLAIDNDPSALMCCKRNIAANVSTQVISTLQSNLIESVSETFDFVLANIVTQTLLELFSQMNIKSILNKNGHLVISGVSLEREPELVKALKRISFSLEERKELNGWVGFRARKIFTSL